MASKTENNIKVNPEKVYLETDEGIIQSEERKWGMPLKEVYKYGLAFYKGNAPLHRLHRFWFRRLVERAPEPKWVQINKDFSAHNKFIA